MNNDDTTKTKLFRSRAALRIAGRIVLSLAAAAATVTGCGWPGTSHSVRFNGFQSEREMGRLPPLPTLADGLNEGRASWDINDSSESDDRYDRAEKRAKDLDALWERAEAAEQDGNLHLDRDLLDEYLKGTEIARDIWSLPTASQQRRNTATDRLDALGALDRGSNTAKVAAYLKARRIHDTDKPDAAEIERALELVQSDANLKDNVAYLKAAELYRQEKFAEAAEAFAVLARQYPQSEKREAAIFMNAVATMKTSATYIPASGGSDYADDPSARADADQPWRDAFAGFQRIIMNYPRGRYVNDAKGWLAYLLLRRHDRAGALVQYYRLLAEKNENARIEAAFSLTLVRSLATDDELARVEKELANEPAAALAYAYHNIYNYSIDPGSAEPPSDGEEIKDSKGEIDYEAEQRRDDERRKEWSKTRATTSRKELVRTLEFSRGLIARYPRLSVGGAFALRAAQASEELGDNDAGASFAQRALQSGLSGDERAQAFWTLGIAEHRRHNFDSARKNFTALLRDYPRGPLTEGARRMLAMIAEDAGDIDGALEQYIALDYSIDVGYFIDTLMTPEQLAGFIARHPDSGKRNEFTYALGIRYLRAGRWQDARSTLAQVHATPTRDYNPYNHEGRCRYSPLTNCADPKAPVEDERSQLIITPRLLLRDMQTANDLEALERHAKEAGGDEEKAEALYQLASYQYEATSLLFYNPLASPGYTNLSELASEGRYRVPNESQILWNSTQEHDRLARALKIYLDVVNRYPRTRAARDSLYTAAVCHERLSGYNPYWREIYQNGLHAGERMVTYRDVWNAYPAYQFPRGTFGWEPATRTVNNGPGWEPAPPAAKPLPRPTKTARLKRVINAVAGRLLSFWNEHGRRWLTELIIVIGLLITAHIAARNRRRLRLRLVRQRRQQSRQVITYPWFEMFWIDRLQPTRRERIRTFLGAKRQEFLELAKDRRSRPVLLRSILSHSVLTGLFLFLFWTFRFG